MSIETLVKEVSDIFVDEIKASLQRLKLGDSDLSESVEARVNVKTGSIDFWMNDYAKYIIGGRKKGVKKVPIMALLGWIKKRGIVGRKVNGRFISRLSLAFAIQRAIWKNGIKGRDFLSPALDGSLEVATDMILAALGSEIDKAFAA